MVSRPIVWFQLHATHCAAVNDYQGPGSGRNVILHTFQPRIKPPFFQLLNVSLVEQWYTRILIRDSRDKDAPRWVSLGISLHMQ
ncbi:hypothetical protein DENSPDRAFT_131640 [Dentipellis sp. KUC8613]|nr:hypothetical protein DENSPDRAFT_131640 [Dentipellis sp. KUC8613]